MPIGSGDLYKCSEEIEEERRRQEGLKGGKSPGKVSGYLQKQALAEVHKNSNIPFVYEDLENMCTPEFGLAFFTCRLKFLKTRLFLSLLLANQSS